MTISKVDQIKALLKSIETGDPEPIQVVDQTRYIQHNPQTHEGSEGLETLFKRLSQTNPRVNIVRAYEDGDYVFAHTEYDFSRRNVGFEVFRFEDGRAVEHWDNIQPRKEPNPSGLSMVDGPNEATDKDKTETNRTHIKNFVHRVLIERELSTLPEFIHPDLIQHSPDMKSGADALTQRLQEQGHDGPRVLYSRLHRILAEGNFVLTVCEGHLDGVHTSFYDLYRVSDGKIAEHWDTIEKVPPVSEWKNDNGKF